MPTISPPLIDVAICATSKASCVPTLTQEAQLLVWCARTSVSEALRQQIRASVRKPLDWPLFSKLALRHGVGVLVYRNLHSVCPTMVPLEILQQLKRYVQASALRNTMLAQELIVLVAALSARGVAALPFKGPTLAVAAYGDVMLRECGDLDFIIRQDDIPIARQVLIQQGYRLKSFDAPDGDVCDEAFHYFTKHDGLLEVDIQWMMARRLFAFRLDRKAFWQRVRPMTISNHSIPTLSSEDLVIVLCVHGTKHAWEQLKWVVDIAELLRAHPGIDWTHILGAASALRCRRMVYLGLSLAHELFDAPLPRTILHSIESDPDLARISPLMPKSLLRETFSGIDEKDGEALYFSLKDSWREQWLYGLSLCREGNIRVLHSPLPWCRLQRYLQGLYWAMYPFYRFAVRCLPSVRARRAIVKWMNYAR